MKRWEQIKGELQELEDQVTALRSELSLLQALCEHPNLPKRAPTEEHCDECPDCGFYAYGYFI